MTQSLAIGTHEMQTFNGHRAVCVLQADGSWIPAEFCTCVDRYDGRGQQWDFACPIDRHQINARERALREIRSL